MFSIPKSVWFGVLSHYERSLLIVLYFLARKDRRVFIPSVEYLMEKAFMGRKAVKKYLKKLGEKGVILKEGKGRFKLRSEKEKVRFFKELGRAKLNPIERAYLSLIWSLLPSQGNGDILYANVEDFQKLLGLSEKTVRNHLKLLHEKGLIEKHRTSNFLAIRPLFPIR